MTSLPYFLLVSTSSLSLCSDSDIASFILLGLSLVLFVWIFINRRFL